MTPIDNTHTLPDTDPTVPHWTGGFGHPCNRGAEAMRRKSYGFFHAYRFLAGGVWGGRKACRFLDPVDQPCTSSAARGLVTSVGGLNTAIEESIMNTQTTLEFRPHVAIINGEIKTTSTDIAEHFGKRHDNVIQAIKKLDCSPEFYALNFKEIQIDIDLGMGRTRKSTAYEITKDGFFFLAMGFTGKQAAQWKEAYIAAFNALAEQLAQPQIGLKRGKKPEALTITPLELDALVNERVKKVLEGEIELKADCPKYHYPLSDWQPQTKVSATAWLTFRELFRVEPGQRPTARLIKQHQAEGDDVSGVAAEVDALYLLVESFYIKLDRMRSLLGDFDQRGLNIRAYP